MPEFNSVLLALAGVATAAPIYLWKNASTFTTTTDNSADLEGNKVSQVKPQVLNYRIWLALVGSLYVMMKLQDGLSAFKLLHHYGFQKIDVGSVYFTELSAAASIGCFLACLGDRFPPNRLIAAAAIVAAVASLAHHDHHLSTLSGSRVVVSCMSTAIPVYVEKLYLAHYQRDNAGISQTLPVLQRSSIYLLSGISVLGTIVAHSAMPLLLAAGFSATFDCAAISAIVACYLVLKKLQVTELEGIQYAGIIENLSSAWVDISTQPHILLLGLSQVAMDSALVVLSYSWISTVEAAAGAEAQYSFISHAMYGSFASGAISLLLVNRNSIKPRSQLLSILFRIAAGIAFAIFLLCNSEKPKFALGLVLGYLGIGGVVGASYIQLILLHFEIFPFKTFCSIQAILKVPPAIVAVLASLNASMASAAKLSVMVTVLFLFASYLQNKLDQEQRLKAGTTK